MNLVLIDKSDIRADGTVHLDGSKARHILNILKAHPGKNLKIGLINGPKGVGIVKDTGDHTVAMQTQFSNVIPQKANIDILLALPRPLVMKRLWSVLPAMGVGRIILTNASKVERYYFDTHWLDPESYMPCIIEGLEQAGDTLIPQVSIHRQLKVLLEDHLDELFPSGKRLVAHPGDDGEPIALCKPHDNERILLAIGAEGGWTEHELSLLREHAFSCVTMGRRTLRTEAACVAALAILGSAVAESQKAQ